MQSFILFLAIKPLYIDYLHKVLPRYPIFAVARTYMILLIYLFSLSYSYIVCIIIFGNGVTLLLLLLLFIYATSGHYMKIYLHKVLPDFKKWGNKWGNTENGVTLFSPII